MRARIAAVVLVVAGLVLSIVTLTQHTVPAASPFAQVVHNFKPVMTQQSVNQLRADLTTVDAGISGLTTTALPALAANTGQTPAQLQASIAQRYPQVATGLQQLPAITKGFTGFADLLDAQRSNFNAAAAIPVTGVSPRTIPPALLGLGALMVLLGLGMLVRPSAKGLPRAAVALGLVTIVVALSASLPQKAQKSADLKAALAPVLTTSAVAADKASLKVMADLATQLQTKLLPDTAAALHVAPAVLAGQLALASPPLGTLFQQLPQIQARFTALVTLIDTNLATWQQASRPSLLVLIRVLLACSAAAVLAGGLALVGMRRPAVIDLADRTLPAGSVPQPTVSPDSAPSHDRLIT